MTREAAGLARNMSAPPRTILNFSPLAPPHGTTSDAIGGGAGLRFVCRLDPRSHLPSSHQSASPGLYYNPTAEQLHHRVRLGLVYALAEIAGKARAVNGTLTRALRTPVETVADQLRDLLVAESLVDAGLPRFGLLLPPHGRGRAVLPGLRRTLAILARRRGKLFLRDADPIVWSAVEGDVCDLWTPTLPEGRVP